MDIKDINVSGITYLHAMEGTDQWYYGLDHLSGDLYEAEELYGLGWEVKGSSLFLVKYPEGDVFNPVKKKKNTSLGQPVYYKGVISFPEVDFECAVVKIHSFDCGSCQTSTVAQVSLKEIEDCYNLRVCVWPLTLIRSDNKGNLDIIWPQKKHLEVTLREALDFRDDDKLILSRWQEDPDYREETVIRDFNTGEILKVIPGNIMLMPDGSQWHIH